MNDTFYSGFTITPYLTCNVPHIYSELNFSFQVLFHLKFMCAWHRRCTLYVSFLQKLLSRLSSLFAKDILIFFSLKRKYGEVAKGKHVIYHLHIIFRFRIINNKFISVCMIMAINTKQFVLILIKAVNELIVLYMFNPCLVTRRK